MKKPLRILLLLLCVLCFNYARASHLAGAEITYKCIGNGQYEVTVKVYRDCNGIQVSQSPVVAKSQFNTVTISSQTKVSSRDITGIASNCPIQSRCVGSFQYGFEEHVYTMTLDLSSYSECEWQLSWEQSARNGNITTGMANQNFYTYSTLNKCLSSCNNSPVFVQAPSFLICHNQDNIYKAEAVDAADGDSLSYMLDTVLQGSGAYATYSGSFSPTKPFTFFGFPNANLSWPAGIHVNPYNGDIAFRPTTVNQVAPIVIRVTEWRNIAGVMTPIGIIRRDIQLIVVSCPNNKAPKFTGTFSKQVCAGETVCIDIVTSDDDAADTVRISWNKGIPGATFTNNNGTVQHASGQVCWTPKQADVRSQAYEFYVTARDNGCPIPSQAIRAFSIFVRDKTAGTRSYTTPGCGYAMISSQFLTGSGGGQTKWRISDSLGNPVDSSNAQHDTLHLQPGLYIAKVTMQTTTTCAVDYIDSFRVTGPKVVTPKLIDPGTRCQGDTAFFTFDDTTDIQGISRSDGRTDYMLIYDQNKQLNMTLTLKSGCTRSYSLPVQVLGRPSSAFGKIVTSPKERTFYLLDTLATAWYRWDFDDSTFSAGFSATKLFSPDGTFTIKLTAIDSNGCSSVSYDTVSVVTGIKGITEKQFTIYPNPFRDEVYLVSDMEEQQFVRIEVLDAGGRQLFNNEQSLDAQRSLKIDLHGKLVPGTYILRVHTSDGINTFKLVKME